MKELITDQQRSGAHEYPARRPSVLEYGQAASPAGGEQSLGDVLLTLAKNWRIVALAVLASLTIGALYCLMAKKEYSATATLELGSDAAVITDRRLSNEFRRQTKEEKWAETQVAKLKRLGIADYVLNTKGIGDRLRELQDQNQSSISRILEKVKAVFERRVHNSTQEQGPYKHDEKFLRHYLGLLKLNPVYSTSLVEIMATTTDPLLSRDIANAQAEGFIEYTRSDRYGKMLESVSFLQDQADKLRDKVADSERELAQYAEANELLSLSKNENLVVKEIGDMTKKLSDAIAKRIRSESLLRAVNNQPIERTTLLDDEAIRQQRVQLKQVESEYANLAQKVTMDYPALQELRARLNSLRQNILEQRRQALTALQMQYQSNAEEEQKLRGQVDERKQAAFDNSRKLVRYNILRREYESFNYLYQSLLAQVKEAQLLSASKPINVGIVEYAAMPQRPSSPNVLLVFCVSLGLGIVLGGAAAAVKNLLDHTVTSPDQAASDLRLPLLGVVPSIPADQSPDRKAAVRFNNLRRWWSSDKNSSEVPQIITFDGTEQFEIKGTASGSGSEAFRAVRTNIMLSSADSVPHVILLTSAQKNEGKTTVASNLAVTLAQAQNRTLIIDTDLRRGKLASCFNAPVGQQSLVDILTGSLPLNNAIMHSAVRNLDVMIAGRRTPNPAELVGSRKIEGLISDLRNHYDYIILDSPPVLSVADALALSRIVDAVVLIVRCGVSEKRLVNRAIEQLRQVQAPMMGLVINGVDTKRKEDYGYAGYDREYIAWD